MSSDSNVTTRPPYLRIGQAARLSGVSEANIRFYEQKKLLVASSRSVSSYRLYSDQDVHTLRFIRSCRSMDMSLDEVQRLVALDLHDRSDCQAASAVLEDHLAHVRQRLSELRALEKDLKSMHALCDGQHAPCRLIEGLHARAEVQNLAEQQAMIGRRAKRHV